jgi:cbb3-type cytochrome oxidase subunit 3
MRLSDIMSAMRLATYAEVALVLFMAAFFAIAVSVFRRRNADTWEQARHLPLDGEHAATDPHTSLEATTVRARRHQD